MDLRGLEQFVEAARQAGVSDQMAVELLRQEGWPEKEIYAAFGANLTARTGLVVPSRIAVRGGAKDAFLYLLSFSTLGTWAVALGSLWFTLIEIAFPDALYPGYAGDPTYSISSSAATLLIAFPIYLFAMRLIGGDVAEHPEKLESPIRKWLTYIALLFAAGIVIGDLITFLAFFLRGELTVRFVLKGITVLTIAGGVLWYYLRGLKPGHRATGDDKLAVSAATALVAVALMVGFVHLGSPAGQREAQADVQRAQDLDRVARQLHSWWAANGQVQERLPVSLGPLLGERGIADPVSAQPYLYSALGGSRYQLCATFSTAHTTNQRLRMNRFAVHPQGTYCFTLDAAVPEF